MNYFTRELIESGQSKDPAILNRHEELWDEACERYFKRLDNLKGGMPPGLRQLVDNYYLHDAVIRGMGQRNRSFLLVIQLDTPPESLLTFVYDLVEEPVIDKAALAPTTVRPVSSWTGSTMRSNALRKSRRPGGSPFCSAMGGKSVCTFATCGWRKHKRCCQVPVTAASLPFRPLRPILPERALRQPRRPL